MTRLFRRSLLILTVLAAPAWAADGPSAETAAQRAEGRFAQMDANRDGVLTQREVRVALEDNKRHAKRAAYAPKLFAKADANGDGQITKAEFIAGKRSWFEKRDSNADGQLGAAERKAARQAAREAKWRRAHGHPTKGHTGYTPGNPDAR